MNQESIVVYITVPSKEEGKKIANVLIEKKLAACVNMLGPLTSVYRWEDAIQEEEELLLMVKTRAELFESHLVPTVQSIHPYDVPEIIALPIQMGSKDYLDWIQQETVPHYPQA